MGCRLLLAILLLPLALGASGPGRGDTLQQHYEGDYDDYDDDDDDDVQQEVSHDRLVSGYPVGPSDARASPGPSVRAMTAQLPAQVAVRNAVAFVKEGTHVGKSLKSDEDRNVRKLFLRSPFLRS